MSKTDETLHLKFARKSLFPYKLAQGKPKLLSERRPGPHGAVLSVKGKEKSVAREPERVVNSKSRIPSLGFLRPTLSSLAKSRFHMKPKGSRIASVASPELHACEVLRDISEEMPAIDVKQNEKELVKEADCDVKITMETQDNLSNAPATTEEPKFSMSSNSFIIWEAHDDDSLDLSRIVLDDVSEKLNRHNITQKENIVATPKFPCSKSTEKKTKRKLCFRSASRRTNHPERWRRPGSPPPDFDVTINSAPVSPDYILPPTSYDIFSTPILNLSSVPCDDVEREETVYYTPCGEMD